MAIVASDWSVTRSNGNIRYIGDDHSGGAPSYATVIELHRWLQDLADDASSSGNDEVDITDPTPTERSTDNIITLLNGYNIDDNAAEHLYDGSIIQLGGAVIYDGIVNFGNADVQIQIHQNGAVLADDWWNYGGAGLNASAAAGISHRFMIKVRTGGADIDGRRILGTCRRYGYTYSEFSINGTSRGNNVLALTDAADLNNQTAIGTVAVYADIVNLNEGYIGIDVDGNGADEFYYSKWDRGAKTINQFYEYMKWLTRDGSASTLYGVNGELFRGITHELTMTTPRSGTFAAFENVTWATGSGRMVAINSTTAATKMWIQLLTGTAPGAGVLITGTSGATGTTSGTATSRTISKPFAGASTGSAIIGAYGFGIEAADLTANDKVFDLTNTQVSPPNIVTFTVTGLVNGEDRVLVGPEDGAGGLKLDQFALNVTLNGAAETAVVMGTAIPLDTPTTGTIRVELDSGVYRRVPYLSWSGPTFTIASTSFTGANAATAGNNVYISYIDLTASASTATFQAVYVSDRTLFIRVRDGGVSPIKTFESTGTLGSTGGSATAIRTSDS